MPKSNSFLDQVIQRIDRIDKAALKNCVLDLSEENKLFYEVLDRLDEGAVLADRKGQIRWINSKAARMLGFPAAVSKNQSLLNVEDKILSDIFDQTFREVKEIRTVADVHLLIPKEQFLRVVVEPLRTRTETLILILLLDRNQEMEAQFDVSRMARVESLLKLAAGVAHEIGNPLNSLSIHLQLLKKEVEKLPKEKRKVLEESIGVIHAETQRLDKIVRNFLKATRKPPLRFRLENINLIMNEALDFMAPELKKNRIQTVFDGDETIPVFFMDRDRLYQVFINLIKNAMESMRPKGGRLTIRVGRREKLVFISFQDQGKGISEKDLPHIFDAYYTTKEEGSGLGLMMVYDSIQEHGGRIEVKSKPGKGAAFTIILPMRLPKLQLPEYKLGKK